MTSLDLDSINTAFIPVPPHRAETMGAALFSPVVPLNASCLVVQALTQNVRMTLDGTTPTASLGFQLVASAGPYRIELNEATVPQFFREAAGAILQYCFGK
jgi:hypothetical protein